MNEGDKICIVREAGENAEPVLAMVAALVSLGVQPYDSQPYLETREIVDDIEKRVVTWCLQTRSEDLRFKTRELIAWWHDEAWLKANPEHPLSYAKAAVANFQRLSAGVNASVPLALVRKGKKFALIPFDASPERRQQLLDLLNK